MAERVIEVRGLRKSYGDVEAVAGIDLHVDRGEVFALLGPNGAARRRRPRSWRATASGRRRGLGPRPRSRDERARAQGAGRHRAAVHGRRTVSSRFARRSTSTRGYYPSPRPTDEVIDLVGLTREARHAREQALGRPAAPAGRRDRAGRATRSCCSWTSPPPASTRPRGGRLGDHTEPHGAREDDLPHDALHGRSPVPREPRRRDRGWRDRGRGPPGDARRQSDRCRRGSASGVPDGTTARRRPRRVRRRLPTARSSSATDDTTYDSTSSRGGPSDAGSRSTSLEVTQTEPRGRLPGADGWRGGREDERRSPPVAARSGSRTRRSGGTRPPRSSPSRSR